MLNKYVNNGYVSYLDEESRSFLFRVLNPVERSEFAKYTRETYTPGVDEVSSVWHPICRLECQRMDEEAGFTGYIGDNWKDKEES